MLLQHRRLGAAKPDPVAPGGGRARRDRGDPRHGMPPSACDPLHGAAGRLGDRAQPLGRCETTSWNSRGLAGPTWASAVSVPSSARCRPSGASSTSPRQRPGSACVSVMRLVLAGGQVTRDRPASSPQRLALDDRASHPWPARAAPPPRGPAPSSASGAGGAAGRHAGRRPRSRAPRARHGRRAAARRGPCPRGRAPAAAGRPGPVIVMSPATASESTRRNQRPQLGGVARPSPAGRASPGGCGPTGRDRGLKRLLDHVAGRLGRQRRAERRAVEAARRGIVGAGGDQHGAAVARHSAAMLSK